ncbi:MAG: DUF4190 domain-containing protein [Streptococcaceae bacterium]|jgi:hypothetical protein|nr:DUF4190 domain-containing protein [Streptococcaceae bacterium]
MESQNNSEKTGLAIAALVLGILALILSWIPIINNVAAPIGFIALVLGVIALIRNRKTKKGLSIAATLISIIAIIIVFVSQAFYSKVVTDAGKSVNSAISAISSEQKTADSSFKWTLADYNALTVGEMTTGAGGESYDTLFAKFGKPSSSSDSTIDSYTTKDVTWDNMGSSNYKSVDLTFTKQSDGSYLLSSKSQTGLS